MPCRAVQQTAQSPRLQALVSGRARGLPLTAQKPDLQAIIVIPAILGFIGTAMALRRADDPREKEAWLNLAIMQIMAFLVALSVMRAMAFAHVMALPGNAVLLAALMTAAQRMKLMPARVLGTAACILATPIGASSITAGLLNREALNSSANSNNPDVPDRYRCTTYATLRGLDALRRPCCSAAGHRRAPARLRIGVVATGHHRNAGGMKEVLSGLTAPTDKARAIVNGRLGRGVSGVLPGRK